jgi:transcriptional regulator with XRE-family HTH domain
MATQLEIARKLGLDVSTVNKILHQVPGLKWKPETVQAVFRTAEELGYNFSKIKFRHQREYPRHQVDVPVGLEVELPGRGITESGRGRLRDISRSGARVSDLQIPSGTLPAGPFKFVLKIRGLKSRKPVKGTPVRVVNNGEVDYALRFDRLLDTKEVQEICRLSG